MSCSKEYMVYSVPWSTMNDDCNSIHYQDIFRATIMIAKCLLMLSTT